MKPNPCGFILVPQAALALNGTALVVYLTILAARSDDTDFVLLTDREIAERLGLNRGHTRRHHAEIEAAGLMRRERDRDGRRGFRLLWPGKANP